MLGPRFGSLSKLEQYARLKVWIGRFRHYQAVQDRDTELTEELRTLSHRVFHQLKWLSRQYEPGYIEAFGKIIRPIGPLTLPRAKSNCCRQSRLAIVFGKLSCS